MVRPKAVLSVVLGNVGLLDAKYKHYRNYIGVIVFFWPFLAHCLISHLASLALNIV